MRSVQRRAHHQARRFTALNSIEGRERFARQNITCAAPGNESFSKTAVRDPTYNMDYLFNLLSFMYFL
jgi:hypothetical protein